jgi:hypothetical protein
VAFHWPSTAELRVHAAWADSADVPGQSELISYEVHADLASLTVPVDPTAHDSFKTSFAQIFFNDTKYHRVTYTMRGISRYTSYYDPKVSADPNNVSIVSNAFPVEIKELWQGPAAQERRTDRAELRALLRYRSDEADASARPRAHPQAAADSRRRIQSQPDFPVADRRRHSAGAEKPPRSTRFCAGAAHSQPAGRRWGLKGAYLSALGSKVAPSRLAAASLPSFKKTGFHHGLGLYETVSDRLFANGTI